MYSKLIAGNKEKQVEHMKKNLECHKKARKFVEEYKKEKDIKSDKDLDQII